MARIIMELGDFVVSSVTFIGGQYGIDCPGKRCGFIRTGI